MELSYSLGLDPKYDVASADKATREDGVEYLSNIVRKIAVMEGELFSGVTYAGWGVPNFIINPEDKKAMLEKYNM